MCVESAYYDSCIFLESLNAGHNEHEACCQLVDASRISWRVSFSPELTAAEATLQEYLDRFEVECASHGVDLHRVTPAAANAAARQNQALKRRLSKRGFRGNDWRHLMGAVASGAHALVTVDPDYWDPQNKAQAKAKRRLDNVKRAIEASLTVEIRLPSEIVGACCT